MQPVEDLVELGQECPGGAHLFVGVAVEHGCCFANRWAGGVALAVGGTVGVSGRVRRLGADLVDVPLCNAYVGRSRMRNSVPSSRWPVRPSLPTIWSKASSSDA
jgi:hypothetical protein